MESQAHQNLLDAASIDRSTGWAKARLIACSVQPGKPGGKQPVRGQGDKLTIDEAADITRMSNKTIGAYLKVWKKASDGLRCQPASQLTPADGATAQLPAEQEWHHFWEGNSHSEAKETTAFDKALKGLQAFEKNALDQSVSIDETKELVEALNNAGLMVGGFSWKA